MVSRNFYSNQGNYPWIDKVQTYLIVLKKLMENIVGPCEEVGFEQDLVSGDDLSVLILTWWLPKQTHRGEWPCICQILTQRLPTYIISQVGVVAVVVMVVAHIKATKQWTRRTSTSPGMEGNGHICHRPETRNMLVRKKLCTRWV